MEILQFQPLSSAVDTTFWAELQSLKLGELRLSERPIPLQGWLDPSNDATTNPALRIDQGSFQHDRQPMGGLTSGIRQSGTLMNVNTHDSFKAFEAASARKKVTQSTVAKLWGAIRDGSAFASPSLFNQFVLLTYADLKRYQFTYWFAFIALEPPSPITSHPAISLDRAFDQQHAAQIAAVCQDGKALEPFWLVQLPPGRPPLRHSLCNWRRILDAQSDASTSGGQEAVAAGEVILAWIDPGSASEHPSWPLRNALLAAAAVLRLRRLRVLCARLHGNSVSTSASLVLDVALPDVPPGWFAAEDEVPKARGWEVQSRSSKIGPRQVDLAAAMDPERLMDAAVDLNLKLMLWRAAPSLDLNAISATRCLLLGSGTLGCAVARTLLGWGVRHITFLDSGHVSYSNPVRQSLFELKDCIGEGQPKAQAAADALRRIFPSVVASGVHMTVPMAGHPVADSEVASVCADAAALEDLIRNHDAVFLLTDTREARWLPTLLCASAGKLAINAALGFDSYLVMRHGGPPLPPLERHDDKAHIVTDDAAVTRCDALAEVQHLQAQCAVSADTAHTALMGHTAHQPNKMTPGDDSSRVSCYFCQDVVAPANSTLGRALDQQCTVARPGLAPIAAAVAVEMLAAVVQEKATGSVEALGAPAHMVRGQLAAGEQTVLRGTAFPQCTACSAAVVSALREGSWPWLLSVLRDPKVLEDLTGLTDMHAAMDLVDDFAVESENEIDELDDAKNTVGRSDDWTAL